MVRFRIANAALLFTGLLLAAGAALWCADAHAQATSPAYIRPLDTATDSDPKKTPYQKFRKTDPRVPVSPLRKFEAPAAAGAGGTGFDSTNARKAKAKSQTKSKAEAAAEEKAIAPGIATPLALSPGQRAAKDKANAAFAQGQPSDPPVPSPGAITPPPKKRKAVDVADPYDALGLRSGGLLYYPAVELLGGYDSNPARVNGGKGAGVYSAAPELRVQSDWARHEFKADLRGSYTWYSPDQTPTLSRPYFNGKVDGRVDVTRDSRIELGVRDLISTDNPSSPNLQTGLSKLPLFTTFGGYAGFTHRFNRLDVGIKGDAERTLYQNSKLTDGTTLSNDDRNYSQYGATVRAGYELSPGLKPFVEGGADTRQHDLATDFSGFQRDSTGYTARAGSTFELSRLLTGEIAIGYVKRNYTDPRLETLQGLIGDGSLTWTATALTTVKLTAASTVGESTNPGVSGVLYRDVGLQVDHALRRWLIGSIKGGYGQDDYVGQTRVDNRYYVALGLTYKLNRMVQIKGEARRQWLVSNDPGSSYNANIFLLGLRLQY